MERRHFYLPLVTGILTPSLVIFMLEVFVAGISPLKAAVDILHRQFAEGHNLFLVMFLSIIPFVALVLLVWVLSFKVKGTRLDCIFWGGFIAIFGLTLFGHFSVWYPLYAPGKHMSSTAVIAFMFILIYCLFILVIGSLIGWGVSFLPKFRNQVIV